MCLFVVVVLHFHSCCYFCYCNFRYYVLSCLSIYSSVYLSVYLSVYQLFFVFIISLIHYSSLSLPHSFSFTIASLSHSLYLSLNLSFYLPLFSSSSSLCYLSYYTINQTAPPHHYTSPSPALLRTLLTPSFSPSRSKTCPPPFTISHHHHLPTQYSLRYNHHSHHHAWNPNIPSSNHYISPLPSPLTILPTKSPSRPDH